MILLSVILLQVFHALGVEVTEGVESVLLSCHVNVSVSSESTVVWSREDLKFSIVHIRQQRGDDLGEQNQRYGNRTWMNKNALQTGDLSLTLRNPTVSDSETYTCTVRRFGQELSQINVPLKVTEPPALWPKVVSPVLLLLFVLAAVAGLLFYCRYKKMKLNPIYKLQLASAVEGQQSVLLPCKTRRYRSADATVEWRRIHTKPVVHMYSNKQGQTFIQMEDYQKRSKMTENPLRTGDLSLTLDNPRPADSGLYVCTVQKGGHKVKQKIVSLHVKENAGLVSGSDVVPDGGLGENRTGSIEDSMSLRENLRLSTERLPALPASSSYESSIRGGPLDQSYRLLNEYMNHHLFQNDANSEEDRGDADPDARLKKSHVRQRSCS